jgi:hypothetical protein
MNKSVNNVGGISFETGRGYRAGATVNGLRIRSQRVKSKREALVMLNTIREALGGMLNTNSSKMNSLYMKGLISITVVT